MIMYRDVYTSYYQWVPPFLIASACLFYLPRWDQARTTFGPFAYQGAFGWVLRMVLWIIFRQGHVRGMFLIVFNCFDMMTPRYIENREEKRDQMISYFRKRLSNKYTNYFIGFIFCEFLNWAIVVSHFFLTDLFLNRRYLDFGFKIIEYYSLSFHKQRVCLISDPRFSFTLRRNLGILTLYATSSPE